MKRILTFAWVALCACSIRAFEVYVADKDGVRIDGGGLSFSSSRTRNPFGVETVRCRLASNADSPRLVRIVASEDFRGATVIWNGRDELSPPNGKHAHPLYMDFTFLMCAAWNASEGVALAAGAEDFNSYVDAEFEKDRFSVSVRAALLKKGAVYECTFHRIGFSPKYGIRDALARYYPLYPARFKRNAHVQQGIYGVCAGYDSWNMPNPEACRFMNSTWEWCHGAGRVWGDLLGEAMPQGKMNADYSWVDRIRFYGRDLKPHSYDNRKLTKKEFADVQNGRLAQAYYCGVVNAFYTMALANISNKIAAGHPDSVAAHNPVAQNTYDYSAEVFAFPECSWGKELRRQIAELVKTRDIGAIAFDVSRPRSVYRGEHLASMPNVSWDRFGPGVVRGVGSAKTFEYVRTLPNKRMAGNAAVAVNTKYQHLSDMLYIDETMLESTPWDRDPPFPLAARFALGEKGLTLWEGFSPRSFDPNFNTWNRREKDRFCNDLSRYAVHRSMAAGASLPGQFCSEYVSKMSRAFVLMNEAGWKPVVGAKCTKGWEMARYGLGENSWLAVNNPVLEPSAARLELFPGELHTGMVKPESKERHLPLVFAPYFGGKSSMEISEGKSFVEFAVGPQLCGVLESVGSADGQGEFEIEWNGDFDAISLNVCSKSFGGELLFRDSFSTYRRKGGRRIFVGPGESASVTYRNECNPGLLEKIRKLNLSDLRNVVVRCAPEEDSRDMAQRISFFFRCVDMPDDLDPKIARKRVSPVKIVEDTTLGPLTVCFGDIILTAGERMEFSGLVRRFLNVVNAVRYPKYGPSVRLEPEARPYFSFERL